MSAPQKGRLIVLEGTDGSGKSTQFAKLCQRVQAEGIAFRRLVFPQYQEESSALLRMYLRGEFGKRPEDVNAYAASSFYAVDRYASYRSGVGKTIVDGTATLESLSDYAMGLDKIDVPRVELFARQSPPGWDVWGNEVESTIPDFWTKCPEVAGDRKE